MPRSRRHAQRRPRRSRRADGVVDDVDAARVGDRQALPRAARSTPPDQAASASIELRRAARGRTRWRRALGQRGLGRPAGDVRDLDVGVERREDRGGGRAERAGAVHDDPAARGRRVAGDGVQRHRRTGRRAPRPRRGSSSGTGNTIGGGPAAARRTRRWRRRRCRCGCPGAAAVEEVPAQASSRPPRTPGTAGSIPRGPARQPRVEHDPLAGVDARRPPGRPLRPSPTTSWPSTCGNEMNAVIGLSSASSKSISTCLVSEPQIPREPRAQHHPVVGPIARVGDLLELHRRRGQVAQEPGASSGGCGRPGSGSQEDERLHGRASDRFSWLGDAGRGTRRCRSS